MSPFSGLGVNLLVETMRMVEPDNVIQIDSPSLGRNYPQVGHDLITCLGAGSQLKSCPGGGGVWSTTCGK